MNVAEDDRYIPIMIGAAFHFALVCRRCGALVAWTGVEDGAGREAHNRFHEVLNDLAADQRPLEVAATGAATKPAADTPWVQMTDFGGKEAR